MSSMIAEQKGLLPTAQASAILDVYARLGLPCSIEGITSETYKRARDEIVVHRDGLLRAPPPLPVGVSNPDPGSHPRPHPNQVRRCRRASARASTWTRSPTTRSTRPLRGCRQPLTLTRTLRTRTRTRTRARTRTPNPNPNPEPRSRTRTRTRTHPNRNPNPNQAFMDDHPHACWDLSKSFNSPDKVESPA
jgi:hypothetical protein